jgi:hypothetical protein
MPPEIYNYKSLQIFVYRLVALDGNILKRQGNILKAIF